MSQVADIMRSSRYHEFTELSGKEQKDFLAQIHEAILHAQKTNDFEEMAAAGLLHHNPRVRAAVVRSVKNLDDDSQAESIVEWGLRDRDELVRLESLSMLSRFTDSPLILMALLDTTGRAPEQIREGYGEGTTYADALSRHWAKILMNSQDADEVVRALPTPMVEAEVQPWIDRANMIEIPSGKRASSERSKALTQVFEKNVGMVFPGFEVQDFAIDRDATTIGEYDVFVEAITEQGHLYCHPDEPYDKDHTRSTIDDLRFTDRHPATGIDWYDAYAYASWAGKRLPTEAEWEWAALGESDHLFSWGKAWDGDHAWYLGRLIGVTVRVRDIPEVLPKTDLTSMESLASTIDHQRSNTSVLGVSGLSGNTWEWTGTRFLDRQPFAPKFGTLDPGEVNGYWATEVAIKGGSFASAAEQLSPVYRGKASLFNRSHEIGFRCAAASGNSANL